MLNSIFHPDLMTELADFLPATVTIQTVTEPDVGTPSYADVAGAVALPCRIAPIKPQREERRAEITVGTATHRILINQKVTGIATKNSANVTVSGVATRYDILAVENDVEGVATRLVVEAVAL